MDIIEEIKTQARLLSNPKFVFLGYQEERLLKNDKKGIIYIDITEKGVFFNQMEVVRVHKESFLMVV